MRRSKKEDVTSNVPQSAVPRRLLSAFDALRIAIPEQLNLGSERERTYMDDTPSWRTANEILCHTNINPPKHPARNVVATLACDGAWAMPYGIDISVRCKGLSRLALKMPKNRTVSTMVWKYSNEAQIVMYHLLRTFPTVTIAVHAGMQVPVDQSLPHTNTNSYIYGLTEETAQAVAQWIYDVVGHPIRYLPEEKISSAVSFLEANGGPQAVPAPPVPTEDEDATLDDTLRRSPSSSPVSPIIPAVPSGTTRPFAESASTPIDNGHLALPFPGAAARAIPLNTRAIPMGGPAPLSPASVAAAAAAAAAAGTAMPLDGSVTLGPLETAAAMQLAAAAAGAVPAPLPGVVPLAPAATMPVAVPTVQQLAAGVAVPMVAPMVTPLEFAAAAAAPPMALYAPPAAQGGRGTPGGGMFGTALQDSYGSVSEQHIDQSSDFSAQQQAFMEKSMSDMSDVESFAKSGVLPPGADVGAPMLQFSESQWLMLYQMYVKHYLSQGGVGMYVPPVTYQYMQQQARMPQAYGHAPPPQQQHQHHPPQRQHQQPLQQQPQQPHELPPQRRPHHAMGHDQPQPPQRHEHHHYAPPQSYSAPQVPQQRFPTSYAYPPSQRDAPYSPQRIGGSFGGRMRSEGGGGRRGGVRAARQSAAQHMPPDMIHTENVVQRHCDHQLCDDVDHATAALLHRYAILKADRSIVKRKYIAIGLREVLKQARRNALAGIIMAANIEGTSTDGLADMVQQVMEQARVTNTLVVFALSREEISSALDKSGNISCVGLLLVDDVQPELDRLRQAAAMARAQFAESKNPAAVRRVGPPPSGVLTTRTAGGAGASSSGTGSSARVACSPERVGDGASSSTAPVNGGGAGAGVGTPDGGSAEAWPSLRKASDGGQGPFAAGLNGNAPDYTPASTAPAAGGGGSGGGGAWSGARGRGGGAGPAGGGGGAGGGVGGGRDGGGRRWPNGVTVSAPPGTGRGIRSTPTP